MKDKNNFLYNNFILKIRYFAKKYKNIFLPYEDLIQEGFLGLLYAKEKFNKNISQNFSEYANFCIKKHILSAIKKEINYKKQLLEFEEEKFNKIEEPNKNLNKGNIINLNFEKNFFEKEEILIYKKIFKEEKNINCIAKELNLTSEKVRQIKQKLIRKMRSKLICQQQTNL